MIWQPLLVLHRAHCFFFDIRCIRSGHVHHRQLTNRPFTTSVWGLHCFTMDGVKTRRGLWRTSLWRLSGRVTSFSFLQKAFPKVKLRRPVGNPTSRIWLKRSPKVKFWRLFGNFTSLRLWSKLSPNVKSWREFGHMTYVRLWSKA